MLGATNPLASAPGTIRGDFAIQTGRNICHGSDSVDSANREIAHWYGKFERFRRKLLEKCRVLNLIVHHNIRMFPVILVYKSTSQSPRCREMQILITRIFRFKPDEINDYASPFINSWVYE